MAFFNGDEREFVEAVSALTFCNPFLPERMAFERRILGGDAVDMGPVWSKRADFAGETPNVLAIQERSEQALATFRSRLAESAEPSAEEWDLYVDLVSYVLYYRYQKPFLDRIAEESGADSFPFYSDFADDLRHFLETGTTGTRPVTPEESAHWFACFFQVRRAFYQTFRFILGASPAAARLRGAVWQSIFTHDMKRYRRSLHRHMGDVSVLITGESGTGKEIVARAIGRSRYIPFDPSRRRFAASWRETFFPLNLSALSATLIESELFGHRKGAFTGATEDHAGWLEVCGQHGTVFLDEVGETAPEIQVKLLRLLEDRRYARLGDTRQRVFAGKVIAATNRDLPEEMASGRFRGDLYYRLCADTIHTPPLREQVADQPSELRNLVLFLAGRVAGDDEQEALADEVMSCIRNDLGLDYPWPGNVRELEQCVRNVMIRRCYTPAASPHDPDAFWNDVKAGTLPADELLRRYCTLVYNLTGSYEAAGRRLGLDRRTVKAKVDGELL